ncbi:hypothetical protein CEXT_368601 [Caerostris extrusa]|uniref:Uncharacterized protein n=1 Tax=Caerostris extrusa TaxID=172846 RepID=A0AAV4MIP0_CAEEX|nr:hypothetical protein CEXT_368601 [Caerostris extrusa]
MLPLYWIRVNELSKTMKMKQHQRDREMGSFAQCKCGPLQYRARLVGFISARKRWRGDDSVKSTPPAAIPLNINAEMEPLIYSLLMNNI